MRYIKLLLMVILSFISMYILMYLMVDKYANVYLNLNQLYMATAMTAPMVLIELLLMSSMYHNRKLNLLIILLTLAIFFLSILGVRKQKGISDKEFLKSMIPHHAAALLMCKQTTLKDPELKKLCNQITSTQQSEINFMKTKLDNIKA